MWIYHLLRTYQQCFTFAGNIVVNVSFYHSLSFWPQLNKCNFFRETFYALILSHSLSLSLLVTISLAVLDVFMLICLTLFHLLSSRCAKLSQSDSRKARTGFMQCYILRASSSILSLSHRSHSLSVNGW